MSLSLVAIKVNVTDMMFSALKKKAMPPIPPTSATMHAKTEALASKNALPLPHVNSIVKKRRQPICKIVWKIIVPTLVPSIHANKFATTMRHVTNPAHHITVVLINVQVTPLLVIKIVCPRGRNVPTPSLNPPNQIFHAHSAADQRTKLANGTVQKTITPFYLPMLETIILVTSIAQLTPLPASLDAKRSSMMIRNA